MAQAPWRLKGRPTKIDHVVARITNPDGSITKVTTADRIIQALAAGNYAEHAAASAGIPKVTLYDWLKRGARYNTALDRGKDLTDFTRLDRLCGDFANAVATAQAEATVRDAALAAQLAQGGFEHRTVTVKKDKDGNVVERTEKVEHLPPDSSMIRWRLERREQATWGKNAPLEITGPEGGPVEVTVAEKRAGFLDHLTERASQLDAAERDDLTVDLGLEATDGEGQADDHAE